MLEDKDFELLEEKTPETNTVVEDDEIKDSDFVLTEVDSTVHEQKFQTKPTTFFKDSLKRFSKNKSSVVAAYILGGLLLLSVVIPAIDTSDLSAPKPEETYLAPKLFKAGTGFWDGTREYKNIAVDVSAMPDAKTEEEKQQYWWPASQKFPQRSAISKKKFTEEQYTNDVSTLGSFGKEGYVHFGYYSDRKQGDVVEFASDELATLDLNEKLYLSVFDTYDEAKIKEVEGKDNLGAPDNYVIGESAMFLVYTEEDPVTHEKETKDVQLTEYAVAHNIGSAASKKDAKLDVSALVKEKTGKDTVEDAYFAVRMIAEHKGKNVCSLIRSIVFESESADADTKKAFDDMSFLDATKQLATSSKEGYKYWSSTGVRRIYLSKAHFCSFVYDTYEAAFGQREIDGFSIFSLLDYEKAGWVSFKDEDGFETLYSDDDGFYFADNFVCKILDAEKCPLAKPIVKEDFYGYENLGDLSVTVTVYNYKVMGYKQMPTYLMGTDKSGKDMLKMVFEGLRTSLLLGIITFGICFTIGLVWGSVSGYFGGTVDLVMERISDILGYIPGIVLLTLIIIHLGSNFGSFLFSMCLTGWLGTAGLTRTQFYRFRGREYVLASRTLGASDARLIARHILPNGLGTIITASVLIIPSVVFSEANISYLGLGLKNESSLGVILSDNQAELLTSPYLLIFPAVIIALLMISFNLFGNGLRDAVNPSLKGEE